MSNLQQLGLSGMPEAETFQQEDSKPSLDDVMRAVERADQVFEKNITARADLNSDWAKHVKAAIDGENESEITSLAQRYLHIGDNTFATNWRQGNQRRVKFMDDDWFRLIPNDTFNADPFLCNIKASYLAANLKKPKSYFKMTWQNVDAQFGLLNSTAMHYRYACDVKPDRKTRRVTENGRTKMTFEQGESKLVHQGGVATFINMFNCYPDVVNCATQNPFERDVYYKEAAMFNAVINNPLFDASKEYVYQDCVIYRGVESLSELEARSVSYEKSSAEKELEYKANTRPTIGQIAIRSAYLNEFKIKDQVYEDVNVFWAKNGGNCYPLLVEFNQLPYKAILTATNWANPWDLYGKSQAQLTYNQHSTRGFLLSALAYEVVSSIFDPVLIPSEFIDAVIKAGGDKNILQAAFRKDPKALNKMIPYQYAGEGIGANIDYRTLIGGVNQGKSNYNLQLIQQGLAMTTGEMQNTQVDLKSADVNASTARGIDFITAQQGDALRSSLDILSECILKPFLEMCLHDMSTKLFPEQFGLELPDEVKARMEQSPEYQNLANEYERVFQLNNVITLPNGQSVPIQYNNLTNKVSLEITREFIESIDADIEIQIENNDYDKQQIRAAITDLTNLTASLPAEAQEFKTMMLAALTEQTLELYKFPKRKELIQKLQMGIINPEQQAQQQAQTQLTQAEAVKTQAQAEKYSAEAKEEATRAQAQGMANEDKIKQDEMIDQLVGV